MTERDGSVVDAALRPATRTFEDAAPLLNDAEALRAKASEDGYLFFKGLIDREKIMALRKEILQILETYGYLDAERPLIDGIADPAAINRLDEADTNWNGVGVPLEVYRDIQSLESFHALAHDPALMRIYEMLFGGKVLPHPRNIGRIMLPHRRLHVTPPHQDFLHVQGATETWTSWIPLGDVPVELGSLSILEGSHKAGLLGVTGNPGAGGLESILCGLGYEWVEGDYEAGDVVTFHSLTVHKALPNRTGNRVRLSVDYRYQPVDQPIEERSLLPHGPFQWDELYQGWRREDLQYYWKSLNMELVPFDESIRWQKEKIC